MNASGQISKIVMAQEFTLNAEVSEKQSNTRLDQAIADLFPEYSRTRLKQWIEQQRVKVDGAVVTKPRAKVLIGQSVEIDALLEDEVTFAPEDIPLNIVYEDDAIIVINKPAGLVVHPGAGNMQGTLLNALLNHCPALSEVPRAGIVHRLDKDTTGLMVVAKTVPAQTWLVSELQKRNITREYEAIAWGNMTAGGTVDQPIGRHPTKRVAMAVHPMGKEATTHYRVAERYRFFTRLRLRLETGRTHQIRVHMAHIKHPLMGDPVYGGRNRLPKGAGESMLEALRGFQRQALHAVALSLLHPDTRELMSWEAPVPEDMLQMAELLRTDTQTHGIL